MKNISSTSLHTISRSLLRVILPAMGVLIITGCHHKKSEIEDETPTVEVAYPIVDSVTLTKTYPGTLEANDWAEVVGRVNGTLLKRHYQDGDYVRKGQLLFSIEPTKYRDAVSQAEASLKTAQSQYDYYSKQYEAMKQALESDAVSKMDVIQAESSMKQAQAAIMTATAELSIARTNLGYCSVTAPLSGYISSSDLNPGAYINGESGEAVLATIVDNSSFAANFEIEESQYEKLVGMAGGTGNAAYRNMKLGFSSKMPKEYTADLNFESPTVDTSTGTMKLKGNVINSDNQLKNGMYVTVSLPYGFNPKAILVKELALSTDQLGKYLYVVNDSDKVVYTPVTVGDLYRDSLRIIEKGLNPGDRYVTKALLTVRAGMKINPVVAGQPARKTGSNKSSSTR